MRGPRRSRLEIYLDVLKALTNRPLKFTHVMYKANVNSVVLKDGLTFLVEKGLVASRVERNEKVFALSEKGFAVLRHFQEIETVFPFVKEEARLSYA